MSGQRVAILDGSHSLFQKDDIGCLEAIPGLDKMVLEVVQDVGNDVEITFVGVGVVCGISGVRRVGRMLHAKIVEQLIAGDRDM